MTVAVFWLLAILEIAIGAAVFASANSPIREVLGINLVGFGILAFGVAGLQNELQKTRREAAKERQDALEEQQAKAAADLKRRSLTITSIDRRQRQTWNGDPKAGSALVS
jgi:hypothetical protein